MLFKRKCEGCRKYKWKWLVRNRTFYSVVLNTTITSNNPLCRKCLIIYKSVPKYEDNTNGQQDNRETKTEDVK